MHDKEGTMSDDPKERRVYFICESCEEHNPEGAVCPREDIAVMPDGTWICDSCYSDCEKSAYGLVASEADDFEFPSFHDLPRPPAYDATPAARISELEARNAKLTEALESIAARKVARCGDYANRIKCYVCGYKSVEPHTEERHAPNCAREVALAAIQQEPKS